MAKYVDLTGEVFGDLIVIGLSHQDRHGYYYWRCYCSCDKEVVKRGSNLTAKIRPTRSCGHRRGKNSYSAPRGKITRHGLSSHRLYGCWKNMMARCYKEHHPDYPKYGARGIYVCDEWHEVGAFINDMNGTYKEGLTLDRSDNNGPYSPDNCVWADWDQQASHTTRTRTYKTPAGDEYIISDLAKLAGIKAGTMHQRLINLKWPLDKAMNTPVRKTKANVAFIKSRILVCNSCETIVPGTDTDMGKCCPKCGLPVSA